MKEIRTQIIFIICFLAAWQIVYQMQAFPELLFPSLKEIGSSFVTGFKDNSLLEYTLYSMSLIVKGMGIAVVLAFVFSGLAVVSRVFHSIYNLIVSICDLLPGVALLPLSLSDAPRNSRLLNIALCRIRKPALNNRSYDTGWICIYINVKFYL